MFQRTISAKNAGNLTTEPFLKPLFSAVLAVTIFSTLPLRADQGLGSSVMALALPWSSIESNLSGLLQQEAEAKKTFKIPSRILSSDGIDLKLGEINAELSAEISGVRVNKLGIQVAGETLQLNARVGGLIIDQVLERSFSGHRVSVRIQAQCEPFSLHIQRGQVTNKYSWRPTSTGLQLQAELFQVNFQPDSVSISDLNCFGLEGLGTEIKTGLFANLRNPVKLQKFLSEEIEKKLNSFISEKWALYKVGSHYQVQEHGLIVYHDSGLSLDFDPEILLYRIREAHQEPQIVLTEKNLNQLTLQKLQQLSKQKINLSDYPEFHRLMRSRFLQFFVWPDLMKFPKSAKFEVETGFIEKLTLTKSSQGYELSGLVRSTLRGERNQVLQDYLRLANQMSARVESQVLDGQLLLDIHHGQSQMTWKFADEYQKNFSPTNRISGTIQRKLNEAIAKDRRISITLPTIDIGGRPWKIRNMLLLEKFAEFPVGPAQK